MTARTGMSRADRTKAIGRLLELVVTTLGLIRDGLRSPEQVEELLTALQIFNDTPYRISPAATSTIPAITTRPDNLSISGALTWMVSWLPGITPEATNFLAVHNFWTIQGLVLVNQNAFQKLRGYNRRIGSNIERGLAALGLRLGLITDIPATTTGSQQFLNQLIPQPTAETLDQKVDELELGVPAANQLKAAKIETVRQLVAETEHRLRQKGLATRPIIEIKERLSERGLWVGMTPEEIAALPTANPPAPPAE